MKNTIFYLLVIFALSGKAQDSKPEAYFLNRSGNCVIPLSELKALDTLKPVLLTAMSKGRSFKIISYEFTSILYGKPVVVTGTGAAISKSIFSLLKRSPENNKIFFDKVKVEEDNGKVRDATGLIIKVK